MRRTLSILVFAALLLTMSSTAMAQQKEKKVIESERITQENPKVAKLKEAVNDKAKAGLNDPPKQHGPVYGDDYCDVVIDNYTNLYIKVWVDNNYKGIVGPYGKITVAAAPGKTVLYARADFTDGSYSYWNPPAFDCGWEFTWRLK